MIEHPLEISMKKVAGGCHLIFSVTDIDNQTKTSKLSISRIKAESILRELGLTTPHSELPQLDPLYMYNSKTTYTTTGTAYRIWLRMRSMNVKKFHQTVKHEWRDYQGFAKWYNENYRYGTYLLVNYKMEKEINETNTYFTTDKTGAYQPT